MYIYIHVGVYIHEFSFFFLFWDSLSLPVSLPSNGIPLSSENPIVHLYLKYMSSTVKLSGNALFYVCGWSFSWIYSYYWAVLFLVSSSISIYHFTVFCSLLVLIEKLTLIALVSSLYVSTDFSLATFKISSFVFIV